MKKLKGTEEDAKLYREIIKEIEADLAEAKATLAKLEDAIKTTAPKNGGKGKGRSKTVAATPTTKTTPVLIQEPAEAFAS